MIIGILGAMQEEITPLLEIFKDYKIIEVGRNKFYEVRYKNATLIIAYSKIGKVHSALTSSTLILHFKCEMIFFSGVAGGLKDDIKIGDLIIASRLCQYDVDITAFGHKLGFIPEGKLFIETSSKLNALAKKVALKLDLKIKEGIIASGDSFIANEDKKAWIIKHFDACAVEMEGASVACVCDNLNIPFCIFRSISDEANNKADINFDEFLDKSARISSRLVVGIIDEII